jgi:hypothetical protein
VRADMARLAVDIPRAGSHFKNMKTGGKVDPHIEWDDQNIPTRQSRRHRWTHVPMEKTMGDYLDPFYNFLRRSVGRIWNDVYSEIRAVISRDSMIGDHLLRSHLRNDVSPQGSVHKRYNSFFVDDNGVLQERKWESFRPVLNTLEKISLSETVSLEQRKGFWFRVTYVKHMPGDPFIDGHQILIPNYYTQITFEEVSRKQLGKRELKEVRDILSAPRKSHPGNFKNPVVLHGKDQRNRPCKVYCDRKALNTTRLEATPRVGFFIYKKFRRSLALLGGTIFTSYYRLQERVV